MRTLRDRVFQRDRGVCVRCGLDTEALRRAIENYAALRQAKAMFHLFAACWPVVAEFIKAIGEAARKWPGSLWECNHIVGVAECGDPTNPENAETLCIPCHKLHTKLLAGRAAKMRRRIAKFHNGNA